MVTGTSPHVGCPLWVPVTVCAAATIRTVPETPEGQFVSSWSALKPLWLVRRRVGPRDGARPSREISWDRAARSARSSCARYVADTGVAPTNTYGRACLQDEASECRRSSRWETLPRNTTVRFPQTPDDEPGRRARTLQAASPHWSWGD